MKKNVFLEANPELGKEFFINPSTEPIVMLNLLKFRTIADYTEHQDLAPTEVISGQSAYQLYYLHTLPFLEAAGSEVIFHGNSKNFLIGPEVEQWDAVLLLRHSSRAKFLEFALNPEYLKGAGHRTAALEDSRLLPISETPILK